VRPAWWVAFHLAGHHGEIGFARLVVPNDARKSRFVSSLMALEAFVARP